MSILKKLKKDLRPDTVGWETAESLAKAEGVSVSSARRLLDSGVKAGLIERKKFSISYREGFRSIFHFREKQ